MVKVLVFHENLSREGNFRSGASWNPRVEGRFRPGFTRDGPP